MPNQFNTTNVTRLQWLQNAIEKHKSTDCLLWPFKRDRDGYGQVWFENSSQQAHRVVFYIVNGHWPEPLTRHTCNTPPCINPQHLIEGTASDNIMDAVACGRWRDSSGEKNCNSKLTTEAVKQIRRSTESHSILASQYGVNHATIDDVIARRSWKHIE